MNSNKSPSFDSVQNVANQLAGSLKDIDETLSKLARSQEKLTKAILQVSKAFNGTTGDIDKIEKAINKMNSRFKDNTRTLDETNNLLSKNKKELKNLSEEYEDLAKAQNKNTKAVKDLNNSIDDLTDSVAIQEKAVEKATETFDFQEKSLDAIQSSLDGLKGKAKELGPEFENNLEAASKGFNAMRDGLKVAETGFQSVGGAIKATGFGLLLLVLQSVSEWLKSNGEGTQYLAGILAGVGTVVKKVESVFAALGEKIFKAVIHPADTIKLVWKNIVSAITNQLKPFSTILQGILNLDFKQVKQGFGQLSTNVNNTVNGIVKTFKKAKDGIVAFAGEVTTSYQEAYNKAGKHQKVTHPKKSLKTNSKPTNNGDKEAYEELIASRARMSAALLQGFAKEIADTEAHFQQLKDKYKGHAETVEQLEKERIAAIDAINKKFRDDDSKKLDEYHKELNKIGMNARQEAQSQLDEEYNKKKDELEKIKQKNDELILGTSVQLMQLEGQPLTETSKLQIENLKKQQAEAQKIYNNASGLLNELKTKHAQDSNALNKDFNQKSSQEKQAKTEADLQTGIDDSRNSGHEWAAMSKELELLKLRHDAEIKATEAKGEKLKAIDEKYAKQKAEIEDKLTTSKIHAGDKFIDAALKNSKKDSAIYKAAFLAKKATSIADTIISTKRSVMESLKAYSGIPFIGQALGIAQAAFMAAQGAMSIAEIAKQKPGFAQGGQYTSDGRGAVLPGYSRTDNTNAYLRSGEAVVVSEAMRNPWARNLVSAINVAYGGRDFSVPNPGNGYAIGGVFTDGGNASRYYSQPLNDQKDLANTLAYQMLNNFPPIYVDVKDVNNQQNILAQTVNRVNL